MMEFQIIKASLYWRERDGQKRMVAGRNAELNYQLDVALKHAFDRQID